MPQTLISACTGFLLSDGASGGGRIGGNIVVEEEGRAASEAEAEVAR